jgi:hypothetical protein
MAVPTIRFRFHPQSLSVVNTERVQPLYHFITQLCAIVGGVFTVVGLVDSALYNAVNALRRKKH